MSRIEQQGEPHVMQKDGDGIIRVSTFKALQRLRAGEPAVAVFGSPLPDLSRGSLVPLVNETTSRKPIVRTLQAAMCLDSAMLLESERVDSRRTKLEPTIPLDLSLGRLALIHTQRVIDRAESDAARAVGKAADGVVADGYVLPVAAALAECMRGDLMILQEIGDILAHNTTASFRLPGYYRLLINTFLKEEGRRPVVAEFVLLARNSLAVLSRPAAIDMTYLSIDQAMVRHPDWATNEYKVEQFMLVGKDKKRRVALKPEVKKAEDTAYVLKRTAPENDDLISQECPANVSGERKAVAVGEEPVRTESLLQVINLRTLQYLMGKRGAAQVFP